MGWNLRVISGNILSINERYYESKSRGNFDKWNKNKNR